MYSFGDLGFFLLSGVQTAHADEQVAVSESTTSITSDNGVIKQSNETKQSAERESIIEKIEADLYTEKTKTEKTPSKNDLKELIKEKDFGTVNEDDSFTSKIGNYKIEFEEIEGWE